MGTGGTESVSAELERIEDQLDRAMSGPAWHGPAVLELLADVTAAEAYAHHIPGAHSIWELLVHLGGTYRLVLRRLEGNTAQLSAVEDWPAVPTPTKENWSSACDTLAELDDRLRHAVLAFPEGALEEPLIDDPPYPAYEQFVGITHHNLYHAGQIALLKRVASTLEAATRAPS
jgi:hypothetical protein